MDHHHWMAQTGDKQMDYTIASGGIAVGMPEKWRDQDVTTPWDGRNDYFFIDVSTLEFPGGAFLEGLNVWPGAEWQKDEPFWRSEYSNDRINQAFVWRREPHQKLVVVDHQGGIRLLQKDAAWELVQPTPKDVSDYFVAMGVQSRTVRAADFVLRNLERMMEAFELNLGNEIAQVQSRRSLIS